MRLQKYIYPDSKVHGAFMGPTWGRQDPGGPHAGPIILLIWETDQPLPDTAQTRQ